MDSSSGAFEDTPRKDRSASNLAGVKASWRTPYIGGMGWAGVNIGVGSIEENRTKTRVGNLCCRKR